MCSLSGLSLNTCIYMHLLSITHTPIAFLTDRPRSQTKMRFSSNAHRCLVYGKMTLTRKRFATCLLQNRKLFKPGHSLCVSLGMFFLKLMRKAKTEPLEKSLKLGCTSFQYLRSSTNAVKNDPNWHLSQGGELRWDPDAVSKCGSSWSCHFTPFE